MADKLRELKKKIARLPYEQLLSIVNNESEGYRAEAVALARAELENRGPVSFREEPADDRSTAKRYSKCRACGGSMRPGLISRDKELIITFTDNSEEHGLDVMACAECGEVRFVVDFETE